MMAMAETKAASAVTRAKKTRAGALALATALSMTCAHTVCAQQTRITPRVDTRLTWTDNVGATHDKDSDWIVEFAPGLNVARENGRLKVLFDASFRNLAYVRDTDRNTSFAAFQGAGQFEAVENTLFIDADAHLSRNNLSSFYGRTGGDDLNVNKRDEIRSWALGPRVQFRLGEATEGIVRYRASWLDSGQSGFGRQRQDMWTGQLGNPRASRLFGWNVDANDVRSHYKTSGQDVRLKLLRATMFARLDESFRLRLSAGHESNDYGFGRKRSDAIFGGGFDWNPTPRTSVSAFSEQRAFGDGYQFSFRHRTAHTIWDIAATRDISSSAETLGGGIYQDPQFLALYNHPTLVAQWPDPALREYYVRMILGYPATGGTGELVSNAYFRSEILRGGVTLIGRRDTLTLSAMRSERTRLSSIGGLSGMDDFALADKIRTTSASASLSHRLTPLSSFSATVTRSHAKSDSTAHLETRRTSATVGVSTRLGMHVRAGVNYNYRRTEGSGAAAESDYTENAVSANLGVTF
jgi:uncharacterized protein (PEP-CTERM system associated)